MVLLYFFVDMQSSINIRDVGTGAEPQHVFRDEPLPAITGYKVAVERFIITNPMGLDLRCAARLARAALQFNAAVQVEYSDKVADGKDVMALVSLDVPGATIVTVSVYGADANLALDAIAYVFHTEYRADYDIRPPTAAGAKAANSGTIRTFMSGGKRWRSGMLQEHSSSAREFQNHSSRG